MSRHTLASKTFPIFLILVAACVGSGGKRKAHLVFIDYSKSASTFMAANQKKVEEIIERVVAEMNTNDLLEVFPIHAYTQSATSMLRLQGPPVRGDLRDRKRKEDWLENTAKPGIRRMWRVNISHDRRMSTDIYPIATKISRMSERDYDVVAYVISDMIQEHKRESFGTLFRKPGETDPVKHAQDRVSELGLEETLTRVDIIIKIPGSPEGDRNYDDIRNSVNIFWEEFYALCGADVIIEDL